MNAHPQCNLRIGSQVTFVHRNYISPVAGKVTWISNGPNGVILHIKKRKFTFGGIVELTVWTV